MSEKMGTWALLMRRGILIHVQKTRSFTKRQMQTAWKRLLASLWRAWRDRNALALARFTVFFNAFLCQCRRKPEAIEADFLPNMSEEEQKRFTPSELILYKHALEYKWTVEQLKKVIAMLRLPEFDSKEIDPDLHKRMEKAVLDGRIKCFNMRKGPADGDQDLDFWTREMEDVVLEIMEDPIFKGNQKYSFEMDLDEAGKRLFGGQANAGVAFQIGQLRYIRRLCQYILVFALYMHRYA